MATEKIIYEPHPVSRERKRELRAQGYRILDAVFAPPEQATSAPVVAGSAAPAGKLSPVPDDWASQHWARQVQIAEVLTGGDLILAEGETKAEAARRVIGEHLAAQGV